MLSYMGRIYANLVESGSKTIEQVPETKRAEVYTYMVIDGHITYSEVPAAYASAVAANLTESGHADLIV